MDDNTRTMPGGRQEKRCCTCAAEIGAGCLCEICFDQLSQLNGARSIDGLGGDYGVPFYSPPYELGRRTPENLNYKDLSKPCRSSPDFVSMSTECAVMVIFNHWEKGGVMPAEGSDRVARFIRYYPKGQKITQRWIGRDLKVKGIGQR